MRVCVTWPNGNQREVEVHTKLELDRFVSWHAQEGYRVDLHREGDELVHLMVRETR